MFGVSLKEQHFQEILAKKPKIDFFEVHSENYLEFDSNNFATFYEIAQKYPISLHSIALSLGSYEEIDKKHLNKIKKLIAKIKNPIFFSDHLSWSSNKNHHFHDLLPLPYTKEAFEIVCDKVQFIQDFLGRQMLVENPSCYFPLKDHQMNETEFLNKLAEKTGCGLILDINNIFVSSYNLNLSAKKYLDEIDIDKVKEIHLAGPSYLEEHKIFLDTHSCKTREETLQLLNYYYKKLNKVPAILVEWDNDVPEFDVLLNEIIRAKNSLIK